MLNQLSHMRLYLGGIFLLINFVFAGFFLRSRIFLDNLVTVPRDGGALVDLNGLDARLITWVLLGSQQRLPLFVQESRLFAYAAGIFLALSRRHLIL